VTSTNLDKTMLKPEVYKN